MSNDIMTKKMEFISTENGIKKLIYDGYLFARHQVYGTKTHWRCREYATKLRCHGRIHTVNNKIVHFIPHNHTVTYDVRKGILGEHSFIVEADDVLDNHNIIVDPLIDDRISNLFVQNDYVEIQSTENNTFAQSATIHSMITNKNYKFESSSLSNNKNSTENSHLSTKTLNILRNKAIFSFNERGNHRLNYGGFDYYRETVVGTKTYWRCLEKSLSNKKCTSKIHSVNKKIIHFTRHSHNTSTVKPENICVNGDASTIAEQKHSVAKQLKHKSSNICQSQFLFSGNLFDRLKTEGDTVYWRCTKYKSNLKCDARIETQHNIVSHCTPHNHDSKDSKDALKKKVKLITAPNGNVKLIYDGFLFGRHDVKGAKTYWRCIASKKSAKNRCFSRIHTINNRVVHFIPHNHTATKAVQNFTSIEDISDNKLPNLDTTPALINQNSIIDPKPEYTTSENGKLQLLFNGNRFHQEEIDGDTIHWRCAEYNSALNCQSRAHTHHRKILNLTEHNHNSELTELNEQFDKKLEYVSNTNGRIRLLYDGYVFYRAEIKGNKSYWRCVELRTKISCRSHIHIINNKVVKFTHHNHSPDEQTAT